MPNFIEWMGYLASLIVLVSLVMSSVKKLRWINLVGSLIFAIYGLLIQSYPVAIMNLGIVVVNIYYLYQMYQKKDLFEIIPLIDTTYLSHFLEVYQKDMSQYLALDMDLSAPDLIRFFVTRNTIPAGLFVGRKMSETQFEILVDYTTPTFRDFKIGQYIYRDQKHYFKDLGFQELITKPGFNKHPQYLEKMGFEATTHNDEVIYVKKI